MPQPSWCIASLPSTTAPSARRRATAAASRVRPRLRAAAAAGRGRDVEGVLHGDRDAGEAAGIDSAPDGGVDGVGAGARRDGVEMPERAERVVLLRAPQGLLARLTRREDA